MTPQERDLIQGVFDRLARVGGGKDADAENFIRDHVRRLPDADYGLVQAVIVLEASLAQAQAQINTLHQQLESGRSGSASGFLGGGASPWGGASVPRAGGPSPQPAWQPPPIAASPLQQASPWAQPGGGFLRNAATMAAGVAGGSLLAEGISSLFGGHRGFGGGFGGGFAGPNETVETVTVNNYYDNQGGGSDDSNLQDASYDSGDGFDSGSDDGFSDT